MSASVWGYRLLFCGIAFVVILLNILPLGPASRTVLAPDLLLGLTICWTLRRPDYVPLGLIAMVFLMADFLMMRPLGLWTLIAIVLTEFLRRQVQQNEALPILTELTQVGAVLVAAFLAERVMLVVLLVERPNLLAHLGQLLTTAVFYPAIIVVSQLAFGVRRLLPGEVDSLGSRV